MINFNVDDLIEKGLVRKNTDPSNNRSVLKYTRKVFFDNLWDLDPRLVECRGIVVDEDDIIISYPFTKCFNLGENNTTIADDHLVTAPRKVNGFLGVCTRWGNDYIVSSSGSLVSDFAELARKWIMKGNVADMQEGYTYMFEICDASDPHIVPEDEGAYLIGCRKCSLNSPMEHEYILDREARVMGYKRPEVITGRFGAIKEYFAKTEGMMVRDQDSGEILCKVKTPHYLSKKALMRMGKNNINAMFDRPEAFKSRLDEEFYECVEYLQTLGKDVWSNVGEQERRAIIENYFKTNGAF